MTTRRDGLSVLAALLLYGDCLRQLGRFDEALAAHQKAIAAAPRSVAPLYKEYAF